MNSFHKTKIILYLQFLKMYEHLLHYTLYYITLASNYKKKKKIVTANARVFLMCLIVVGAETFRAVALQKQGW